MTFLTPGCGGITWIPSGLEGRRTLVDITQVPFLSPVSRNAVSTGPQMKAPGAPHPLLWVLCMALSPVSPVCPIEEGSASISSVLSGRSWGRSFPVFLHVSVIWLARQRKKLTLSGQVHVLVVGHFV